MSSNLNDIEYNFHLDKEQMQHDYPASDIQWIYLNDINNGSYSNNYINFSNINLLGSDTSKFLDFSQAYVQIPITVQATCSAVSGGASVNCYWGNPSAVTAGAPTTMADAKENAYAVGMKPFHHIIDYASLKIGGVPVNRNSQWNNFYINEQLKKMNKDEYDLMGEILNYSLDSAESLNTASATGATVSYIIESNNNTVCPNSANALSLGPSTKSFQNQGHLSRMLRLNNDLVNSNLKAAGVSSATLQNSYQNAYLGANGTAAANNLYSTIYWTYNCIVPLSKIHDFYAKMPSINSTQGFELRLQTNVGSPNQNYWTHSFTIAAGALDLTSSASQFGAVGTATATATLTNLTCSSSQSFGRTCPFILSIPNVSGNNPAAGNFVGTGCAVFPATSAANATTVTIRVSSLIGYQNTGSVNQPCRLWVPMITFNPSYTNSIMRNPVYKMLYRDFYVDTISGIQSGGSVSRLYSIQISRPRTMYIIPFLSTTNTTAVNAATTYPYQMLTSSAPTTCSPCRLRNFNLQIGGSNIFVNPLQYNTDFYDNNQLHLLAKEIANGNSYKSQLFSGLITKRMWELAYGVYAFNIEKVDSIESDNLTKNFQISFTVESASGTIAYSYDFICIIDYECEMYLDRITGTITSK